MAGEGEVLRILSTGIHQNQLRRVRYWIRAMYRVGRNNPDQIAGNPIETGVDGADNDIQEENAAFRKNAVYGKYGKQRYFRTGAPQVLSIKENRQRIRCLHCGEYFPEPDFDYTESSQLCIGCWEVAAGIIHEQEPEQFSFSARLKTGNEPGNLPVMSR